MVQVFFQPLYKRYFASTVSFAFVFTIASYIAMFLIPFFLAYASSCILFGHSDEYVALWKKFEWYREHPNVHFTHDYILYVQGTSQNGDSDLNGFWSTFPEMNAVVDPTILRPVTNAVV